MVSLCYEMTSIIQNTMPESETVAVLRMTPNQIDFGVDLLARFGLVLAVVEEGQPIPGSFWGDEEAGLIGTTVYVRPDTPVHSMLHEACHCICMDRARRAWLHTDAGGGYDEEDAVCYLQILLADYLPAVGREQIMRDMDAWGYSFRLGSTRAWFEQDAEDARAWLLEHKLINDEGEPTWQIRR